MLLLPAFLLISNISSAQAGTGCPANTALDRPFDTAGAIATESPQAMPGLSYFILPGNCQISVETKSRKLKQTNLVIATDSACRAKEAELLKEYSAPLENFFMQGLEGRTWVWQPAPKRVLAFTLAGTDYSMGCSVTWAVAP